jgi:hypothetical protein
LIDEYSEVLYLIAIVRTPYGLEEAAVGHHFTPMGKETVQKFEFLSSEVLYAVPPPHFVHFEIHFHVA